MYFNYYDREDARYYIAVKGDINGDGKASSTDLSVFKLVYTKQREVDYIYAKAIDRVGNETPASNNGTIVKTDPMPEMGEHVKIEPSETEATNKNVTVEFKKDEETEGLHLEYQVGGTNGEWKKGESCEVDTNTDIYVRLVEDETGEPGEWIKVTVDNIDKVKPEAFQYIATPTTHSITLRGKTTDEASEGAREGVAGIKEYQFRLMDKEGAPLTEWITLPELPSANQYAEYTFTRAVNGITQGETYQVSMRAIDKARNITEASNEPKTVTVKSLPKTSEHVTVEHSTEDPTNKPVTIKYQTEEGTWEEYQSEGILVDKNREVNIKLVDENDVTIGTKSVTINNIDQA